MTLTNFSIPYTNELEATDRGLVVTGQPDFESWYNLWQWLKERDAAMPWIIGDLLNYGEAAYGEAYSQIFEADDEADGHYSKGTLKEYKSVAKLWPLSSRLDGILWSYHQAVAHLPMEQRLALLEHCREHNIRRAELRLMVRELNDGKQPNPPTRLDDLNHELTQENYRQEQALAQKDEEIADLRRQLDLPQAAILSADVPDYVAKAIANLSNFFDDGGEAYESVTVFSDGRVLWNPKK